MLNVWAEKEMSYNLSDCRVDLCGHLAIKATMHM